MLPRGRKRRLRLCRRPVVERRRPHSRLREKRQELRRSVETTKAVQAKDVFDFSASKLSDQKSAVFARNQSYRRSHYLINIHSALKFHHSIIPKYQKFAFAILISLLFFTLKIVATLI